MKFRTTIELANKNATGFRVPVEVDLTSNAESLRRSRCCAKAGNSVDLKYRLESVFVVPLLAHLGESVLPHDLA